MHKRLLLFVALVALLGFYSCSEKASVVEEPEVNTGGGTFTVGDVKFEIPDGALDKEVKLTAKEIVDANDLLSHRSRSRGGQQGLLLRLQLLEDQQLLFQQ